MHNTPFAGVQWTVRIFVLMTCMFDPTCIRLPTTFLLKLSIYEDECSARVIFQLMYAHPTWVPFLRSCSSPQEHPYRHNNKILVTHVAKSQSNLFLTWELTNFFFLKLDPFKRSKITYHLACYDYDILFQGVSTLTCLIVARFFQDFYHKKS